MELQLVSRHQGVPEKDEEKKKAKGGAGGFMARKGYFEKNSGLFLELSKGIKGLMNCLLGASYRQWSKGGWLSQECSCEGGPCVY